VIKKYALLLLMLLLVFWPPPAKAVEPGSVKLEEEKKVAYG
jgi:hypothetical protein